MILREFAWWFQRVTLDQHEDRWKSLESELKRLDEELSEGIVPERIYDYFNPSRPVEYYDRQKTYRIKDRFDEFCIIKKSEFELGDVGRPNLHVELGKVRTARLEAEKKSLQQAIESVEKSIKEFHYNEFLYGVSADNQTVDLFERMFPNQPVFSLVACSPSTVHWKQEGF